MERGVKWKIGGRKGTERNGEGRVGKEKGRVGEERREVKGRGRKEGSEG